MSRLCLIRIFPGSRHIAPTEFIFALVQVMFNTCRVALRAFLFLTDRHRPVAVSKR